LKNEFLERDSLPVDPEFAAFVREALSGPQLPVVDGSLMNRLREDFERRRAG